MDTITKQTGDLKKILALLRKKDPVTLEAIYDHFAPVLYGFALKMTKSETTSEYLVKDAVYFIHKNGSSFDESQQTISLWLINILHKFAGKKMQLVSNFQNQKPLFSVDTEATDKPSINSPLFKNTDKREYLTNDIQKNILDIVLFGGKTISDVANLTGMDEIKIKKILHESVSIQRKNSLPWK